MPKECHSFHQPGDGFRAAAILIRDLSLRALWASPLHYWGWWGSLWELPEPRSEFARLSGVIRAPLGGVIESIVRRRRRCSWCGNWFWRQGWWNPLAGVNIFEEHCSGKCADEEIDLLPY